MCPAYSQAPTPPSSAGVATYRPTAGTKMLVIEAPQSDPQTVPPDHSGLAAKRVAVRRARRNCRRGHRACRGSVMVGRRARSNRCRGARIRSLGMDLRRGRGRQRDGSARPSGGRLASRGRSRAARRRRRQSARRGVYARAGEPRARAGQRLADRAGARRASRLPGRQSTPSTRFATRGSTTRRQTEGSISRASVPTTSTSPTSH